MNIYVSSTGTINLVFVDGAGAAVDPSAIALVIKDSQGATKATKAIGDLTHDSTGHYHYQHQTASADATGVWRIECTLDQLDFVLLSPNQGPRDRVTVP